MEKMDVKNDRLIYRLTFEVTSGANWVVGK